MWPSATYVSELVGIALIPDKHGDWLTGWLITTALVLWLKRLDQAISVEQTLSHWVSLLLDHEPRWVLMLGQEAWLEGIGRALLTLFYFAFLAENPLCTFTFLIFGKKNKLFTLSFLLFSGKCRWHAKIHVKLVVFSYKLRWISIFDDHQSSCQCQQKWSQMLKSVSFNLLWTSVLAQTQSKGTRRWSERRQMCRLNKQDKWAAVMSERVRGSGTKPQPYKYTNLEAGDVGKQGT